MAGWLKVKSEAVVRRIAVSVLMFFERGEIVLLHLTVPAKAYSSNQKKLHAASLPPLLAGKALAAICDAG